MTGIDHTPAFLFFMQDHISVMVFSNSWFIQLIRCTMVSFFMLLIDWCIYAVLMLLYLKCNMSELQINIRIIIVSGNTDYTYKLDNEFILLYFPFYDWRNMCHIKFSVQSFKLKMISCRNYFDTFQNVCIVINLAVCKSNICFCWYKTIMRLPIPHDVFLVKWNRYGRWLYDVISHHNNIKNLTTTMILILQRKTATLPSLIYL